MIVFLLTNQGHINVVDLQAAGAQICEPDNYWDIERNNASSYSDCHFWYGDGNGDAECSQTGADVVAEAACFLAWRELECFAKFCAIYFGLGEACDTFFSTCVYAYARKMFYLGD